ncbi:hypothetical protein PVAND_006038 [Polypedilum vanderplanki]|uniref:Uncharacterized protein n=1 Tax=Polypedilum vanderplanki TaxID=319348 RepID=A0A9J6C2T0_POLVA|nr:hypothetical protein PVAND_006038 [Polypedilum vanderplanki]
MKLISEIGENKYKLSLGSTNESSLESALDTTHEIEEFDIWLEIKSDNEVQRLKNLFEKLGGNVKKLSWCNWNHEHVLPANAVAELLNNFKSLKSLSLSSWNKPFSGDAGTLNLPNIEAIEVSECGNFVFDFLSAALPENVIKCVKVSQVSEPDEKFTSFVKKQSSIVSLNLRGDFNIADAITGLKLECLRVIIYEKEGETDNQKKFLQTLIKSQQNLKNLDLINDSDYSFCFVDDELFADITSLSKLESLAITIDGLTPSGIKGISNLSALKNLQLKTNRESSLPLFKEFAEIKNSSLENLILNLWSFEIPAETYTAIGQNCENLKSLKITLGTWHKISFFAKAFPQLEELNVRFGEANNRVEFGQVYDASETITQSKMKRLRLQFWGSETIDTESFLKFLGVFTNLEKLDIHTKFPFCATFINQITEKLGTIKNIKLSSFEVRNNETFPAETINALKALREKVNFVSLSLSNIQHVDFGQGLPENVDGESRQFTFKPLIDGLEGVYEAKDSSLANIRIHNNLELIAGKDI